MNKELVEQTCNECKTLNLVTGHYNCTSCRAENIFVIIKEVKGMKRGKKKWLS